MPNDTLTEFPEHRFTQELMRISTEWRRGHPADDSLVELFNVLIHYGLECEGDSQSWKEQVASFKESTEGSLVNHQLSILMAMVQDTQARLRSRLLSVAERLESHAAARHANARYGSVVHREYMSQSLAEFRDRP